MEKTISKIKERLMKVHIGTSVIPVSLFQEDTGEETESPDICLIIYGGSRDFSQKKLVDIKTLLCSNNIIAASFDFRGTGDDVDNFYNTGLHTRIEDVKAVFNELIKLFPDGRIYVLAISMGGYIATFLDPRDVAGLVLVAPAAYDSRAVQEKINFGPEFSALIRTKGSYLKSDAFERMEKFRLVHATVISFEDDEVVPKAVPLLYFNSHPGAIEYRKIYKALPGKHNGNFSNPERMQEIVNALVRL